MAIVDKNKEVKSFFDKTHLYLHKDFGVRVRVDIARDLLSDKVTGKRVIDLGCGNGAVGLQFIHQARELDFLDISDKMLDLVRHSIADSDLHRAAFFNCDLEAFRAQEKYDVIIAFGLIMHVNSTSESLKKMYEILDPGGFLLIQYTDYKHPISRINKLLSPQNAYELNRVDESSFKELIQKQGFQIVASLKYSLLLKGLGRLPDAFLYRFHKWTYKNQFIGRLGMDHVYLLKK